MKAARVQRFGPPKVIEIDDLPLPKPATGQLLVRVKGAGVGHWDALVREGKVPQGLPLVLGSVLSGIVEAIGPDVAGFKVGDEVYGATNAQFTGGYAQYALPSAGRMAQKPKTLNFVQAGCGSNCECHGIADALRLCPRSRWANCTHPWGGGQRRCVRGTNGQPSRPSCSRDCFDT